MQDVSLQQVNNGTCIGVDVPCVIIDNDECYYRTSKRSPINAPVCVCIHGSGADGVVWSYQVSRLSRHFRIIAPDLPGHGRSGGTARESVEQYAAWLDRFVAAMDIPSFFIMGHSFGGAVAQQYARQHAGRVTGLVLVGTGTGFRLSRTYRSLHEQGMSPDEIIAAGGALPAALRKGYELLVQQSGGVLHEDLIAAGKFDSTSWISSLEVPCLVVWGSNDVITPRELPESLARGLPQSSFRIIQGAGHVVMIDARDAFNEAVKTFIDDVEANDRHT